MLDQPPTADVGCASIAFPVGAASSYVMCIDIESGTPDTDATPTKNTVSSAKMVAAEKAATSCSRMVRSFHFFMVPFPRRAEPAQQPCPAPAAPGPSNVLMSGVRVRVRVCVRWCGCVWV